jgi:hypothetical protein
VSNPLRVRIAEERQARTLFDALEGMKDVELRPDDGGWEVSVTSSAADGLVQVLDAVRRVLAGQPAASAQVLLDGREYLLQGE